MRESGWKCGCSSCVLYIYIHIYIVYLPCFIRTGVNTQVGDITQGSFLSKGQRGLTQDKILQRNKETTQNRWTQSVTRHWRGGAGQETRLEYDPKQTQANRVCCHGDAKWNEAPSVFPVLSENYFFTRRNLWCSRVALAKPSGKRKVTRTTFWWGWGGNWCSCNQNYFFSMRRNLWCSSRDGVWISRNVQESGKLPERLFSDALWTAGILQEHVQ